MKDDGKKRLREIREAKKAVERAEKARREAFRKACAALFNEYSMCLVADGDLSAHLKIEELRDGSEFPIGDLPE